MNASHRSARRNRCLLVLAAKENVQEAWASAENDHERMLLENVLVTVRAYLKDMCEKAGLPFQ